MDKFMLGVIVTFILAMLMTTIYGLYLAFAASLLLGFVVLLVEPAPLVIGLIALFGHPELCRRIVEAVSKVFGG